MKKNFLETVTLSHYLPNTPFRLQTDGSDVGISGVLYQMDSENQPRIISLVSRVLSSSKSQSTTTEKELLAIVYSLIKFRTYLIGREFKILTDNESLTFFLSTPYHNARLMRWSLFLQEYQYAIEHCKGSDNVVADFFSRNFCDPNIRSWENNFLLWNVLNETSPNDKMSPSSLRIIGKLKMHKELLGELRNVKNLQQADEIIQALIKKQSKALIFRNEEGVIYCKTKKEDRWKLVIPRAMIETLLTSTHEQCGHAGNYKLFGYLTKFFCWRYMRRDVKNFTRGCDLCQRVKYLNIRMEGSYEFVSATKPNELISIDFSGLLPQSTAGVKCILVVQEVFSKHVTLYPMKRATTKNCIIKLQDHYFVKVGKPDRCLSDNGTQFSSPRWKSTLAALRVKAIFSSVRHPQSNPVERTMRELGKLFRTYCSERHTGWAPHLPYVQDCLNLLRHQSTGEVPYELHFGQSSKEKIWELFPLLKAQPINREVQLQLANERLQKAFQQRSKSQVKPSKVRISIDDLVMLKVPHLSNASQKHIHKFFHIYEGPYRVLSVTGNNAFRLADPMDRSRVKGVYNRVHLRKYHGAFAG